MQWHPPATFLHHLLVCIHKFLPQEIKNTYLIKVPTWRPDINEEVDIVEELIRILGYDKIQLIKPEVDSPKNILTVKQKLHRFAQRSIANKGYMETITYSFTNSKIDTLFGLHNNNLLITDALGSSFLVFGVYYFIKNLCC